ncbi:MAG: SpoIIE family protein phosphatase [Thermodesulfobacteriota bacterium]
MRIRWKMLILMLTISVLPMLVMRGYGQRVIEDLGDELAARTRNTLIEQANTDLERLVENHVRGVRREKEIIEMALHVQASELEKRITGPIKTHLGGVFFRSHASSDTAFESEDTLFESYCRRVENSKCVSLTVSHSDQTVKAPGTPADESPTPVEETVQRISSMTPVYLFLKQAHPDLIMWQLTAFENGVQAVYPSVEYMPLHNLLETEWYREAQSLDRLVWGTPVIDPLTRKICFVAAMPIHDPEGEIIGVTAIMFPVNVVLRANEQMRNLSDNSTCLLVRPETVSDSNRTAIRIIADEEEAHGDRGRPGWRHMEAPLWLKSMPEEKLRPILTDLEMNKSGVREILYQGREALAAYGKIAANGTALLLLVPKADILAEADAMGRYVREGFQERIRVTGVMLVGIILVVVALALFLSRYLTQNIRKLDEASHRLAKGDFSARVHIRSRDEIGELGEVFNRMISGLEERIQMKHALDVAMHLQQNLLPETPPPIPGTDIAARSIYCDETGGDFFDFIPLDRGLKRSYGIVVGDVSGHGISAALLMGTARSFLRCRVEQAGSIGRIISDVNTLVCRDTGETGHFLTLFYLEMSPDAGEIRWVRAGHDPALLYDPAADEFKELIGDGMALGVDPSYEYSENVLKDVSEGQILLIGTDGIWETQNSHDEMFTKDRLQAVMREHADRKADDIADAITERVAAFRGDMPQEDDITLVINKIEKDPNSKETQSEDGME